MTMNAPPRKTTLVVATHKRYRMPQSDLYLPVQVGAAGKADLGYQRDDDGEHISSRNPRFCELTGLYWAYRNLDSKYWGLVHYRRYFGRPSILPVLLPSFGGRGSKDKYDLLLDERDVLRLLDRHDVIVPRRQHYVIETIASHYAHTHNASDLEETRAVLRDLYPQYVADWDAVMRRRSAHMFNMFVMRDDQAREYCEWLFDVLFELERRIDISKYDAFHARMFGRVSEFMLDVWIRHHNLSCAEVPVVYMGRIDWPRKIASFVKARFAGVKYERSF
ncbi:DUF4422 domain-containing protein [Bifidobacterium sp. UTBIF-78]|uniref:DUF4422 domain-containing protein n=1 Tax=Bifidobacterium sp. UTBIF-78 TaxID=1465263 RepID=UPI001C615D39|nr:DUF4422 domain-containing protein [Bifidobacterium sp. UTBIF-78]TPF95435.1 hypothetical protein BG22_01930 [Bifidobacterium sp. UTBIF-78]